MRHTPCGCRSAYLVGVRTNFRLPPVSTMRRAQQCRYFASSLPPSKRHSRLTIVRRGCNRCRIAGIHGEAMYTAPTLRSACSPSSCKPAMAGSRGRALGAPRRERKPQRSETQDGDEKQSGGLFFSGETLVGGLPMGVRSTSMTAQSSSYYYTYKYTCKVRFPYRQLCRVSQ